MKLYNKNIGNYGEDIASNYLLSKNHKILSRNFRCKQGEIDIISKHNNILIFTEVKSRYSLDFGKPLESISSYKLNKIKSVASYYIYTKSLYNINIRFDIIEIYFNYYNNKFKINHIENAF
ncbi:YraN family protein [uncultured Clostridium sp.]|uniref:YraN family protein n=1 Tax=uncultured Clostridium sp. TaxID=59620 RepID=UPI0025EF1DBB|nr:YraN family protein [uncultured Clostridium sp.]